MFQNKFDRLNQLYEKNKAYTNNILLCNENLKAERDLEKLESKKMSILQEELICLQRKKTAVEDELKKVINRLIFLIILLFLG